MPIKEGQQPNQLINEKSPYLLQHAYNPVDWYPWGEEAFAKAKAENKPIFLSIGYSCFHWCHVMERQCFKDEEVAELLNKHYVAIKVDREERPDIIVKLLTHLTDKPSVHGEATAYACRNFACREPITNMEAVR
ncbi:uncharacterized protein YyaL (SSP411 family) [Paenibacillus wynnii]|nr:uncharacterized protein YyaL (SSP411 family) [Paenibacillus wynnii]